MEPVIERISQMGIVPVVTLEDAKDARALAEALSRGGLPCAEVTFRTDAAEEAIRIMSREVPEMLVGAGTVLSVEQAERALAAGAKFMVSPGFQEKVIRYGRERGCPVLPGVSNPSEVGRAAELGLDVVKFFPAEQNGGIAMLKALAAPYPQMKFMPTGGITEENLRAYLDFDRIVACGGSWMVKKELVETGRFDEIERLTQNAVSRMLGFEIDLLEGTAEMVAVTTRDMRRALYHLRQRGVLGEDLSMVTQEKKSIREIRFQLKPGGTCFQLMQR